MSIFRKSVQAIYRAFPMRTLITNKTEEYIYETNGKKRLVDSKNEIIEWKNYSDRVEIIKENGDIIIHKTYLDHDMSRPPRINVLRFSETYDHDYKHTFITITPEEVSVGNNMDRKESVYKVSKDSWK